MLSAREPATENAAQPATVIAPKPAAKQEANKAQLDFDSLATNNKSFKSEYPPSKQGQPAFPGELSDFHWDLNSDEPHKARRKLILQKYPELKKLFGFCWMTKYTSVTMVLAQFGFAYYLRDKMWTPQFWLIAYVFGATMTHSLFLAIHEISHFLAFEKPIYNRYLGMIANLPIGIPYCTAFRGYHMEHHTLQGYDTIDTDIPTVLEARLLSSTLGKLFYCTCQILFYALRPMFVKAQTFTFWHFANWAFQISCMAVMTYFWGPNPFLYFLTCDFLAGSLHPMAGHFIAEHFVFVEGYETYSYYGSLNLLAYNVGYHNEHHDFPRIPGSRLPLVRKIAPEFYNNLPEVKSWPGTIYNFIMMPHMTQYSRQKRPSKSKSD